MQDIPEILKPYSDAFRVGMPTTMYFWASPPAFYFPIAWRGRTARVTEHHLRSQQLFSAALDDIMPRRASIHRRFGLDGVRETP
jgi:hypothetical protein